MANVLYKPHNDRQQRVFRCDNAGKKIEEGTDVLNNKVVEALFALNENETMADVEIEINTPDGIFDTTIVTVHKPIVIQGYDEILLEKKKLEKIAQLTENCNNKRYGQVFTVILNDVPCGFDTTEQTQVDLQTAAIVTATGATYDNWVTNNGVTLNLTAEDVQLIFRTFYSLVSPLYTRVLEITTDINAAKNLEELEAVDIDL